MAGLAIGAYDGWQTFLVLIGVCLILGCWLAALLDIFRHTFQRSHQKVLWVFIVTLFPLVGVLVYALLGRKQKIK
ncbi:MAG: PLDc N-terminal domain-containing protein [Cyclobacteriaceae bacterium]